MTNFLRPPLTDEKREFYSNYRQRKINGVLASEKKTNFQKRPPSMKMDPSPKCVPEVQTRQKETFSPDCHDSEPDKSADEKINRGEVCRYCGEKTNQSFKYCPKCGKQIKFQNSEQEDSEYLEINMMDLILDKGSLNGRKIKTQAKGYYETGNLTLHTDNFSEYVEVDVKNIPRKEKKDLMTSSSVHARYVVWGKLTTSRYNNGLQIEAQKVVVLCDNDDY